MKKLMMALVVLIALPLTSFAAEKKAEKKSDVKIDFQEPPFYMFSYDEFKDLRDEQKKAYLSGFMKLAKKLPLTSTLSQKELDEASVWDESWDALMTKVYTDCADKDAKATCDNLAGVRGDVLTAFGNKKMENRAAEAADEAKKAKSKH